MSKLDYKFCANCGKETQWRIKHVKNKDKSRCLRCEQRK